MIFAVACVTLGETCGTFGDPEEWSARCFSPMWSQITSDGRHRMYSPGREGMVRWPLAERGTRGVHGFDGMRDRMRYIPEADSSSALSTLGRSACQHIPRCPLPTGWPVTRSHTSPVPGLDRPATIFFPAVYGAAGVSTTQYPAPQGQRVKLEGPRMSLAQRVQQPPKKTTGSPCSVGALLDRLTGKELAAFNEMLGTPEARGWPASDIYDALRAEGYQVGLQTINRHRGRKCRCFL